MGQGNQGIAAIVARTDQTKHFALIVFSISKEFNFISQAVTGIFHHLSIG